MATLSITCNTNVGLGCGGPIWNA